MKDNANMIAMKNAIINYIKSQIPKDPNKAHIGVVSNGRVIIGNSSFSYTPAVDMYFGENSRVACIRPENTSSAIVVGVI